MTNCCCPPPRIRYVGQPKLDSLICDNYDEVNNLTPIFRVRRHRNRTIKNDEPDKFSVGILRSLIPSHDKAMYFDDTEMNGQRYSMCLMAFALLHIKPVYKWKRKIIDNLTEAGVEHYANAQEEVDGSGSKNYTSNEQVIGRVFKLENYEFEVELGEQFIPEVTDEDDSTDVNINNLKSALQNFFKKRKYCLLSTTNLYLFLWRCNGIYFLLDFYGRTSDLELSRQGGFATLICMKELKNIDYFVTQKSGLGKKDIFTLREMRLIMLVNPEGKIMLTHYTVERADEFVQVSYDYAYLKSKLHLSLRQKDPLISRCALPVGVAAIIASKIDHPASWDTKNLSKIICYGFYICQCCWEYCQASNDEVNYDNFPNLLRIGQFSVSLTINPQIAEGTWRCVPRYMGTELTSIIDNLWNTGKNYLLLSIKQQTYALWKKNNYYYLFDPYRHRLPKSENRSASLRMFSSKEMFFQVLNLVLLQSNTKTKFFIHQVIVTDIKSAAIFGCMPPEPVSPDGDAVDVQSINESICFREDFKHCMDVLGQESDDDEEDSLIEEEILEESEVEPPAGEEEGGGPGDLEESEVEGIESSDEDGNAKHRGRPAKARKGASKSKGKSKKGGKDKGASGEGKSVGKGGKGKKAKEGRKSRLSESGAGDSKEKKRKSRPSTQKDDKDDHKKDNKDDAKKDDKADAKKDDKTEAKKDDKAEAKKDDKAEAKKDDKAEAKKDDKAEAKKDDKVDEKKEDKAEAKKDDKAEAKKEDKVDDKKEDKAEAKKDDKVDDKKENKVDDKKEDKADAKKDDKDDAKKDDKVGGKRTSKDNGKRTSKDNGKRPSKDNGKRTSKSDSKRTSKVDNKESGKAQDIISKKDEKDKCDLNDGQKQDKWKTDDSKLENKRESSNQKSIGERGSDGYGGSKIKGTLESEDDRYGKTKDKNIDQDYEAKTKADFGSGVTFGHFPYHKVSGQQERPDSATCSQQHKYDDGFGYSSVCRKGTFPGQRREPFTLGVAGSETGTYKSICGLLRTAFKYADRVLTMTPYGNFVVFRGVNNIEKSYYVFDGCTCNIDSFRHLDLSRGTAGLLHFNNLHNAISYIVDTRHIRKCLTKTREQLVDEICNRYCNVATT